MRVTNSMMISQLMKNLNRNLKRIENHQYQLATGKKIVKPSQDPVGNTRSLQARTELSKIEQYIKNVEDAKAWLVEAETALDEINSLIVRAYELTVDAANDSKTPEDRQAIAKEIDQLMKQLLEAANSSYAGRSVFGGYNTAEKPFEVREIDGQMFLLYNGEEIANLSDPDSQPDVNVVLEKIEFEVGAGVKMDIATPGPEVLGTGNDNLYAVFYGLFQALNDGTNTDRISEYIGKLQDQQQHILSQLAEVGGKTNRLDLIKTRLEADELNYTSIKSHVEDVDHEKVIMEFMMAEIVYRSSLAVGARIIQPTLVDFLR
ncbi:MAG: flagellar hook-associated protein FlgL [Clostridiales bacterium]|nr:flagellar hook-associated protein FlgL [Clostridiales bacterium]